MRICQPKEEKGSCAFDGRTVHIGFSK
jgi:hypothetical protein